MYFLLFGGRPCPSNVGRIIKKEAVQILLLNKMHITLIIQYLLIFRANNDQKRTMRTFPVQAL